MIISLQVDMMVKEKGLIFSKGRLNRLMGYFQSLRRYWSLASVYKHSGVYFIRIGSQLEENGLDSQM
jgi:hypothetical protein